VEQAQELLEPQILAVVAGVHILVKVMLVALAVQAL
jgi:hypothetical protein